MAFLMNKASILSPLRSRFQNTEGSFSLPSRGYHIELGEREKTLLADDSALRRFKSHTKSVKQVKRIGDVLTIIVVAGCCYEIYVRAVMREEARKAVKSATPV